MLFSSTQLLRLSCQIESFAPLATTFFLEKLLVDWTERCGHLDF